MAKRHTEGIKHIIMEFCRTFRGRLWEYKIGTFRALYSNAGVRVGVQGVPDCFGYTFPTAALNPAVSTFVEVKTLAKPTLTDGQRAFMENAAGKNCICIVLRELKGGGWKEFNYGEEGFYCRAARAAPKRRKRLRGRGKTSGV